jgi:fucose 4-O-acetylase-like acetyltransferase
MAYSGSDGTIRFCMDFFELYHGGIETMRKNVTREKYIDVVRGIAILLVITGHLGMPSSIQTFIYGFHMPLFFILSGFLYHPEKWENAGLPAFARKKAHDYLLPYLVLSIINFLFNLVLESRNLPVAELKASSQSHLLWLLLSNDVYGTSPNCEALWFLPCLFLGSVGFYLVQRQIRSISQRLPQTRACVVSLHLAFFAVLFLLQLLFAAQNIQLPWHINILPSVLLFMEFGYLISGRHVMNRRTAPGNSTAGNVEVIHFEYLFFNQPSFLGFAALFVGAAGIHLNTSALDLNHMSFGNPFAALCGALGMSYAILCFCAHILDKCALLELYGRNTLLIMGTHMLFDSILLLVENRIPFLRSLGYQWWLNAILLFLLFVPVCRALEKFRKRKPKQADKNT